MDRKTRSNRRVSPRKWALAAAVVFGAVFAVSSLVTITQLRKTVAAQKAAAERLQSQIDELESTPAYLLSQATQAQQTKQYDTALIQYERIVAQCPASSEAAEARQRIALVQHELSRRKAASEAEVRQREAAAEVEAKRKRAEEEARRRAHEESIKPPLQLVRAMVSFNAIDNPEARVVVRNVSRKTVDAYTIGFHCYDRYGDPVNHYVNDTNRFGGLCQRTVRPGQTAGSGYYWTLYGHENTAKVRAVLEKVHMTDGSEWEPQPGQEIAVWGRSKQ